jgi:hypothetical protein
MDLVSISGLGFDIESAEVLTDDETGIKYYRIPRDAVLFRGDSNPRIGNTIEFDDSTPVFFGFNRDNVFENYGVAFIFETKEELNLIAIDQNQDTPFYANMPQEYKTILNENYGYPEKNGIRDSVSRKDKDLSLYIRENYKNFDGYASKMMNASGNLKFHSEAMICFPKTKLSVGERMDIGDSPLKRKYDEWRDRANRPEEKKRQRSNDEEDSFPAKRRMMFDDDDEFDGGKRKKRRTTRSKKGRKSKKTIKRKSARKTKRTKK